MRILIVDDETAGSKALRPLFAARGKNKTKVRATAGAPEIGKLLIARAPKKVSRKKGAKGRATAAPAGNEQLDVGDQPEQSSAVFDALGIALLNRGVPEGAALIELGLRIRRKFYGNDHPVTALSINSYSRVQRERGDYEGATASANDALRINRLVFGEAGYPVAASLLELGLVQLLQGLFAEALRTGEEGLAILRAVGLYETDPNSTRLMDVIARAQGALNQLDTAEASFKTLLELDRKQLGTRKHPKYATHLANYGGVLEAQKKRRAAAKTYLNAIDLYLNSLNRDRHPNLIDLYANLGSLLRTPPEDLKGAGRYLEKALQLGIAVRGESHTLVGNDYANLARWHYDAGARDNASKGFTKAMGIYELNVRDTALPSDHFFIAEALTWQGRIAVESGSPAEGARAEPLLRRARKIWPAQLGPGTVGEAMATGYLGRALGLQDANSDEGCQLLCQAYRDLQGNPQASPEILKQFATWIKDQGCDCGPNPTAKAKST
jgi:tetratricopeptide (TPR) repeat protein